MDTKTVIKSQYHASLAMLRQVIEGCPPELWQRPEDKNKFWHVAFHAIFYTHLYLNPTEEDFTPWPQHREEVVSLEPKEGETEVRPYTQVEILKYLAYLTERVDAMVDDLNFEAPAGFYWLPFNKLELQFYNIRHLMLHSGELAERLWQAAGVEGRWVGKRPD